MRYYQLIFVEQEEDFDIFNQEKRLTLPVEKKEPITVKITTIWERRARTKTESKQKI